MIGRRRKNSYFTDTSYPTVGTIDDLFFLFVDALTHTHTPIVTIKTTRARAIAASHNNRETMIDASLARCCKCSAAG